MKRIVLVLTVLVFILIGGSYLYLGWGENKGQGWLISEGDVRGSAIIANGLTYTLNYKQQEGVLRELNNSKKVRLASLDPSLPESVENILVYLFDQEAPLVFTPVSANYSLLDYSKWKKPYYLQLNQPEDLQIIVELAFDK